MQPKPILTFPLVVGNTMFGGGLILRTWHPVRTLSATQDIEIPESQLEETIWAQLSNVILSRFVAIAESTRYYANNSLYGNYREKCKAAADELESAAKAMQQARFSHFAKVKLWLSRLEAVAEFRKKADPTICNMRKILSAAFAHYSETTIYVNS